jgi:UDP-glucose 4-epimerase
MPKKILVTGGAGFIGANLVRLLLDEGYRVRVLDNFSVGCRKYLEGLDLEIMEGDILDTDAVAQAVDGMDGVVHLAAQTGVPGSLEDPYHDCETNVIGTLNMLEASRHAKVERFIFASSNAPLGRQEPPATEDKAPLPIAPYGASKLASEGYCLAYHGSWGLGTVVLRFANVYGPYSAHKSSVVAQFFKDTLTKGEITIDGDGQQTRDFIYVKDLCRAVHLALKSEVSGEVFQIATGEETSILDLAEMVQEVMRQDIDMQHGPSRQGDIRENYSEITKAKSLLGWKSLVALKEGLHSTWNWLQETYAY